MSMDKEDVTKKKKKKEVALINKMEYYSARKKNEVILLTAPWMDKEAVVHIYNGVVFSYKKEWDNAICNNTDGPWSDHTK